MEKMTIHRALGELKLIGARIEKGIAELTVSGIQIGDRLVNNNITKDEFQEQAKRKFQSVTDLIARRIKIKSAIVKANSLTPVVIAGETMTIADAINMKTQIEDKHSLLQRLNAVQGSVKAQIERHNDKIDQNALSLAQQTLQKQNVKIGDEDVQKAMDPYIKANRAVLVDPIGVDKTVEDMHKKVTDFATEVDAILSEVNAVTIIEF